jgi:hypothetical protein
VNWAPIDRLSQMSDMVNSDLEKYAKALDKSVLPSSTHIVVHNNISAQS